MDHQSLALKAVIALMRTQGKLLKSLKADIARYGLNTTEFAVLELIYHKGEQPIQHISERILIASSSTTYVVNQLEKKGYLERCVDVEDRRVFYAKLTPAGQAFMARIFPQHAERIQEIFGNLSAEELTVLLKSLRQLSI